MNVSTIRYKDGKPVAYKIICIKGYELEGIEIKKGDLSECCFGRPIMRPDLWRKATMDDIETYLNKPNRL